MKYILSLKVILVVAVMCGMAYGQDVYDLERIKDASLLELKVLQEWHPVETTPPTRQKIVEITLCDFDNGRKVRIPVTYVVPVTGRPCNFIVSYGWLAPTVYEEFDGLQTKMLESNVGFVLPAIGPIKKMKPDGPQISAEMNQLYKKTGNIKYTKMWMWGTTYMRAITAALTEKEHFLSEKIACDGRSKSAGAGVQALIYYPEVTGLYARVWPSATFPEYTSQAYKEQVEQDNRTFYQKLAAGEITQLGTMDDDAYAEMQKKAKRIVANGAYPKSSRFSNTSEVWAHMILVAENLETLKRKNARYSFFVGSNDNITMDVPRLAQKYPDYPITYYPGGRHGGMSRFIGISGTPDTEEAKANRIAFFSEFYLGEDALLEKPKIEYDYQPADRTLSVTVTFREDSPKEVALHYANNRFAAGSVGYEYDVWEQQAMEQKDNGLWQLRLVVPAHVKTVSLLSFQEGEKETTSYSSSNYVTVQTN
jgi:hypothetical protein